MSKKRKFSMTGLVLVICMIICLLIGLAVVPGGFGSDNKKDLDDENTPGLQDVIENGSPLMIFDKRASVKMLITDFDEDRVECVDATLNDGGNSASLHVTDQGEITSIYKALKNIVIGDELDAGKSSAADCTVSFTLADGSTCGFTFESDEVYVLDGKRYTAAGTEGLWSVIQELANE